MIAMKQSPSMLVRTRRWAALMAFSSLLAIFADATDAQSPKEGEPAKLPMLVMPIGYADCKLTLADEVWNKKIFSTPNKEQEDRRFDLFGPSGTSVNNYFGEITCGGFQFEPVKENCGTIDDGVVRIELDAKHPRADSGALREAVVAALAKAAQYVDFSRYDVNHDKVLSPKELVIVVVSAGGTEDGTYSKNLTFYSRVDLGGCRIGGFVVVSERRDDLRTVYGNLAKAAGVKPEYKDFPVSVGTLVHELGHEFGTPDLPFARYLTAVGYGQKNSRTTLFPGTKLEYGRNTPCHYGAYTMVKAGFVEAILLEKTGTYEVHSAGTGKYNVYKIATKDPKEYFLIENRQREGSDLTMGVKSKYRTVGGVAIWHINEAFGKNDDQDRQRVAIEEASEGILGYSHLKKSRDFVALDPFYPVPGNAEFSGASRPNNRSYSGELQPWKMTDFSPSRSAMTFRFTGLRQESEKPSSSSADRPSLNKTTAEPWWRTYTPIASVRLNARDLETIKPGAARGVDTYGWYGFWYLDAVERARTYDAMRQKLREAGVKRILYYDLGEVGDYAGFFANDGRMVFTGWSLPWWNGKEPLAARWFGLDAFMRDVSWAPFPTAKAYSLPAFTMPDGKPADDLYAVLTRRGLDGGWKFDFSSNDKITDDIAQRSGLAKLSGKQSDRAEVQGRNGWQTVRLVSVDFANPQLRDYVCREIERIIPKLRPDGIHADNFGDNNLGHANQSAFGLWAVYTFRDFLQRHFSRDELKKMGVDDPATFDIAAYIREKPFESRGRAWHALNPKWTTDPLWCCYRVHLVESALAYHRAFHQAAKKSAREANLDCAVFGNTVPFPLGGTLMQGACDVAHFEWSTVHGWWGMRAMGLPPSGRIGYVARLGAAMSDSPFCWPSLYVSKDKSGPGHENLHKVLAFDCLANRGILEFGHWYLDGYSPGTPESAGVVNRFITANAGRLSHRRYLADVAVVHSAWSEIASCSVFNPVADQFVDEYCGWCQFLGDTHRQWDVVLQRNLTAANLSRFPVVVLPSVLSLTDAEAGELSRYVAGGGRVIATGQTGTRFGPDRFLFPREKKVEIAGSRVVDDKPGVTYWRKDRDAEAAKRLADLLAFSGFRPRLTTDAPATVGVNLNIGQDASGELLTLDLNNYDITVETDTIRAAPPFTTTLRLPEEWRGQAVTILCSCPEKPDFVVPDSDVKIDMTSGTLRVKTPPFETALLLILSQRR